MVSLRSRPVKATQSLSQSIEVSENSEIDPDEVFISKVLLNLLKDFRETYTEYALLNKLAQESVLEGPWFADLRAIMEDINEKEKSSLFGISTIRNHIKREEVFAIVKQITKANPHLKTKLRPRETSKTLAELLDLDHLETLILDLSCRFTEMSYDFRSLLDGLDIGYQSPAHMFSSLFGYPLRDAQKATAGVLFNAGILMKDAIAPDGMWGINHELADAFTNRNLNPNDLDKALFPHMLKTDLKVADYPHLQNEIGRCIDIIENNCSGKKKKENGINVMFWGLAGTGKTELAIAIAKERGWNLKVIGDISPEKMNENSRNSRLTSLKLASKIFRNQPKTVLLFDEMEDLFKHDQNANFSKAFINRIIETTEIPIIWTTNQLVELGQPVLRRMVYNIGFEVPPVEARTVIWKKYFETYKVKTDEESLQAVSKAYAVPPAVIRNAAHVISTTFGKKKVTKENLFEIVGSLDTLVNYGFKQTIKEPERKQADSYDLSCINADHDMEEFTDKILKAKDHGFSLCLNGAPGTGKCLDPNEPILMYDGTVKISRDLLVGDQLMGPDSKPRNVLSTSWGRGPMYEVRPAKGKSWRCNGDHILSLRASASREFGKLKTVTVEEWLKWSNVQKSSWKQWRANVDFSEKAEPTIDPYLIGLFLGDGTCSETGTLSIHSADIEITEYLRSAAESMGVTLRERDYSGKTCIDHAFVFGQRGHNSGPIDLRIQLGNYGMFNKRDDKFIPFEIKTGSRLTRRKVLAGLLDSDGYLDKGGVFDFISKSKQLSEDVCFVARSLGLAAYYTETFKRCQTGNGGIYHRVCISGHLNIIPTLIKRKQAKKRISYKDVTNTGFDIVAVGEGDWFGITLDGDHLYLLDDFTVTHNTEYGRYLASKLGKEVLFKRASDLVSMWVGETEANIAKAFAEAKKKKKILLIDEGDSFLRDREKARQSWEVTQVNEMLSQMEHHTEPFILTTNLMKDLDAASLRRFTFKLKFEYMTSEQARRLFKKFYGAEAPQELDRNPMLAPGDYANVKKQIDILGIKDAKEIFNMLEAETKLKPGKRNGIGF